MQWLKAISDYTGGHHGFRYQIFVSILCSFASLLCISANLLNADAFAALPASWMVLLLSERLIDFPPHGCGEV